MSGFVAGEAVEWWHQPRGGYGYGHWVPAVVVRDQPTANPEGRVAIDAELRDGSVVRRRVYAKRLRRIHYVSDFGGTDCVGRELVHRRRGVS